MLFRSLKIFAIDPGFNTITNPTAIKITPKIRLFVFLFWLKSKTIKTPKTIEKIPKIIEIVDITILGYARIKIPKIIILKPITISTPLLFKIRFLI